MSEPLSKDLAEQVLAVVVAAHAGWIKEFGTRPHLTTLDGVQVIMWESDSPDDWAHTVTAGGSSEESRCLAAEASQEFGVPITVPDAEPLTFPPDVEVEPYCSYALALYPTGE